MPLTERQHEMRETGVGASEVYDVLNGGIATYARKVGEAEPFEGTSLTEFGQRIERVIGEAWQERHPGLRIYTPGTLRHPAYEWALASPDRVVAKPGLGRPARDEWLSLLEIKTVFFSSREYGEGADEIPERHLVQVAWQQEVCGVDEATLVALVNGDYREYPITRDRELGGMLLDLVGRWWRDHVLARVPPPVDGSAAYTDYLRRRHPKDSAPALPVTPALRALVAKVREAKAVTKAAETAETLASNALRAALGDAAGVEDLCTYRANKPSTRVDLEAAIEGFLCLLEEHGFGREWARALWATTVQNFTTTKPGARVLRLSATKEKAP